jgi:hypothetical protein
MTQRNRATIKTYFETGDVPVQAEFGDGFDSEIFWLDDVDTDGTLAANSDSKIATQKAVKTYADTKVVANGAIAGATKTKITYDAKGLVTSGADATTADVADSADKRYCTDAQKTAIGTIGNLTTAPATNTANSVPRWNGANSKTLSDGLVVGTAANNLVQLDGSAKLPAVDGSALTNLPAGGGSFWTLMAGTPTRVGNTSFTITGDYTALIAKGMVIKWTEAAVVRMAMVSIPSTYGAPNTTITIVGDTMASIDASSLKYAMVGAEAFIAKFAYAGTIGATGADVANAYYATEPMRVLAADLQVGTAGTTNSTTVDINKGGTTMFTTKPTLATTVATSPTPFTADTTSALALADRMTIDIDAIQTTCAIDLYVQVYLYPTRYLNLT